MASVPGFAYHLKFLRPIADSDGVVAGLVESLVPATIMPIIIVTGVYLICR